MKNKDLDWNDLKYFLATARCSGLSGAAIALRSTPSTVSRHISTLENCLGMKLFLRHQAGYQLTDDGSKLLEHVVQMEEVVLSAARGETGASGAEVTGEVRFSTTEILALHLVVPHLPSLRARYRGLSIDLNISLDAADLSRREADLVLRVAAPAFDGGGGDYVAVRAGEMTFAPYCLDTLVGAAVDDRGSEGWRALDYVTWSPSRADLPMSQWMKTAFPSSAPALACDSMESQLCAMRAGLGVGLLPCFVGDKESSLRRLESNHAVVSRDLWLVYHRDSKSNRRVITLRNFIQELVATHLY
jgi:DNA-binding transcriptional LysR family regulator